MIKKKQERLNFIDLQIYLKLDKNFIALVLFKMHSKFPAFALFFFV